MKLIGKIIGGMVFVCAALAAHAATETVGGIEWRYTVKDGKASVGGGISGAPAIPTTTEGAIAIPETLGGCPVTGIGDYAFYKCEKLTDAALPDGLTSIGSYAFGECDSLGSVTIPSGIANWGMNSFYYSGLTNVVLSEGLATIGNGAFEYCKKLRSITIPQSVTNLQSSAFRFCSGLTDVALPEGLTSIGSYAFGDCASLGSMTIPAGVTAWSYAFDDSGLTNVVLSEGLKSIGGSAFSGCGKLESVAIPASVTTIDSYAFRDCTSLSKVELPEGLKSIGSSAFSGCSKLGMMTVPASVTSIAGSAFSSCSSLAMVFFVGNAPASVGTGIYSSTSTNLVTYVKSDSTGWKGAGSSELPELWPVGDASARAIQHIFPDGLHTQAVEGVAWTFTVKDGVASVGGGTSDTPAVPTSTAGVVSIPAILGGCPVTGIGDYAFYGCAGLTSVSIPVDVTSVGSSAFSGSGTLTAVFFSGNAPTYVGSGIYESDPAGLVTYVKPGTTGWKAAGSTELPETWPVGDADARAIQSQFEDGVHTQTVSGIAWTFTIKNGMATLGGGTASLKAVPKDTAGSISIPEILGGCQVVGIGNNAFNDCSNLTSVDIPACVDTLGNYAFANCTSLVSVELHDGLKSIGDSAFRYCGKLVAVVIPASVTALEEWAFYSCTSLTSVELPEGLKSIGGYAFYGCSKLGAVTVPGSVTSVGESAFYSSSLTNVVLSEGVVSLSQWAFWNCSKLESVTIPASLKTISSQAFAGCVKLDTFVIDPDNAYFSTQNGMLLSKDGTKLISASSASGFVTVPNGVVNIGDWAFDECDSLVSVTFPPSVKSLGMRLSEECFKLSSFIFTGDAPAADRQAYSGGWGGNFATYVREESTGWIAPGETGLPERWPDSFGAPILYIDHVYTRTQVVNGVTWTYGIKNGTALIGGPNGAVGKGIVGDLVIPPAFDGCPVVEIADGAFESCAKVTSVQIPGTVARIGATAFRGCDSLTSVTVPEGVTNIGEYAFAECSSLQRVVLPFSVVRIDDYAFASNPALWQMCLVCENPSAADTIYVDSLAVTNFVKMSTNWGDGTGRIINSAWPYDSPDARPMNMTNGGSYDVAFSLGENGTRSGGGGLAQTVDFFGAATAPTVSAKSGWRFTGWDVPFDCVMKNTAVTAQYEKVPYDGGDYTVAANGYEWTFTVADSVAVITGVAPVPEGHVEIPEALGGCTNVEISASVFAGCSLLTEVVVPKYSGETRIGETAFGDCANLQSITFAGRVSTVADGAFRGCSSLTGVNFNDPRGPVTVGTGIFNGTPANLLVAVGIYYDIHTTQVSGWGGEGDAVLPEKWPAGDPDARTIVKYTSNGGYCQTVDGVEWNFYLNGDIVDLGEVPSGNAIDPSTAGDVVVPAELGCRPVVGISESAFRSCTLLTSVTVPASVTYVGNYAFESCGSLTSVIFEGDAPSSNSPIYRMTLPELVTYVKPGSTGWVASGVTGLPASWPSGNASYARAIQYLDGVYTQTVDGVEWTFAVAGNRATVTSVEPKPTGTLEIPNDLGGCIVSALGDGVFADCADLTRVTIPSNVTTIGACAFAGCGLAQLRFPSSVTSVGADAFAGFASGKVYVDSLEDIERVQNLLSAGGATVSGLRFVEGEFPPPDGVYTQVVDGIEWTYTITDGEASVGGGSSSSTAIPTNTTGDVAVPSVLGGCPVVAIGYGAFGCYSLRSVTIPEGVVSIDADAFPVGALDMPAFEEILVAATNPMYASQDGVLYDKSMSTIVYCPHAKTSVTVPGTVSTIGEMVFHHHFKLKSVEMSEGVKSIGSSAFEDCEAMVALTIPESVTNIGEYAFSSCQSLKSVKIPEGVTSIGEGAFEFCDALESVTVSAGRTFVGDYAFVGCTNLTSVTFEGDAPTTVGTGIYEGTPTNLVTYVRPGSTGWNGEGSTDLPELWPVGDGEDARAIQYRNADGVYTQEVDGIAWTFTVRDGNACVGNGVGNAIDVSISGSVWIPSSLGGCPVVEIMDNAFYSCGMSSVMIPEGVSVVGLGVFVECRSLRTVVFPASLKSIGRPFANWAFVDVVFKGNAPTSFGDLYVISGVCTNYVRVGSKGWDGDPESTVIPDTWPQVGPSSHITHSMPMVAVEGPLSVTFDLGEHGRRTGGGEMVQTVAAFETAVAPEVAADVGWAFTGWSASNVFDCVIADATVTALYVSTVPPDGVYTQVVDGIEWTYTIDNGEASVGGGGQFTAVPMGTAGKITIPSTLGGCPVTAIGDGAFFWCDSLTSVTIPGNVRSIGETAFYDCSSLVSLTISEGVTRVGENAVYACRALKSVTIPASVTEIVGAPFVNCDRLEEIVVEAANPSYVSQDGVLYDKSMLTLVKCPGAKDAVTIPAGVASIGDDAFACCSSLTSVTIPGGVTSIGDWAFSRCFALTSLVVPKGVTNIGDCAFAQCEALKTMYFKGNAPVSHDIYQLTPDDLTTYVCEGTKGWDGNPESTAIPEMWPVGDMYARPIVAVPAEATVTFDLGVHGVRTGGGELVQTVAAFGAAVAPEVAADVGWSFTGWSASNVFDCVVADTTVTALYALTASVEIGGRSLDPDAMPTPPEPDDDGENDTGVRNVTKTYDGEATNVSVEVTVPAEGATVKFRADGADEWTDGAEFAGFVDAGTNKVWYLVESTGYATVSNYAWVTVLPRPVEVAIVGHTNTVAYTGYPHYVTDYETVVDDELYNPAWIEFSGESCAIERTEVGRSVMGLKAADFANTNANFDVAFSVTDGWLEVTAMPDGSHEEVVDGVAFKFTVVGGKASLGGGSNKATVVPTSTQGTVKVPATLGGCPVTALGRSAFDDCAGVTEVILPVGLVEVGSTAFRGCVSLREALLPGSVKTVGTGAFTGCSALEELALPNGLVSIGNYAFSYCKSVTAVSVPATVTSIGYMAFEGCSGIETIRFNGNVPSGLARSCLLDTATRVFYPRAYESAYAAIVPAEKFAGYSDTKGLMLMNAVSAGRPVLVDDAWANETLDSRFGKGKVAEFKEKFGRDFAAALFKATGKVGSDGRMMTVFDDFVAGTDPTDENSRLQANVEIGADGKPKVSWMPDLNKGATTDARAYRVMGAKNLGDEWTEVPSGSEADFNFFTVEVSMPNN